MIQCISQQLRSANSERRCEASPVNRPLIGSTPFSFFNLATMSFRGVLSLCRVGQVMANTATAVELRGANAAVSGEKENSRTFETKSGFVFAGSRLDF